MPVFAPLFSVGTERVSVRWLTLTYPTSVEVLRALLPAPVAPGVQPDVGVWVAEFIGAEFIGNDGTVERRPAYMQGGVSVRCDYHGRDAAYAVATFVEGLNHGILGRELFGLPKKQAQEVKLHEHGSSLDVSWVAAQGKKLFTASAHLSSARTERRPAPRWFDSHLTHKLIPSAEGHGYDISRLVEIPWSFTEADDMRSGTASVAWERDATDPLHILSPAGPVIADYGNSVLQIDYGQYREHVADFPTFGTPSW
ncbi:acetoacetate decarboxylase family protein [Microbacterium sp. QXD-8]|uniref:Acetoacetate decarboxylase family protein n=2 Tax=Microbacterium psychrotolerans TaxID=3068321 RepID=A0ABU0YW20_9MICO|nr:acetoacetate decarboxylase family protein [Microbacterium sp. QXD-8]